MPSTRMLTDSRERAKPASSITKPTCMPKTRNAAISVQAVLIALIVSTGSGASPSAAWATGGMKTDISARTIIRPIALPLNSSATFRLMRRSRAFVRSRCQAGVSAVLMPCPPVA